jgi:hypothetical protein
MIAQMLSTCGSINRLERPTGVIVPGPDHAQKGVTESGAILPVGCHAALPVHVRLVEDVARFELHPTFQITVALFSLDNG